MTLFIGDITKGIPMGLASPDSGSGGGGGGDLPSNLAYTDKEQSFTKENIFAGGLKALSVSETDIRKLETEIELITEADVSTGKTFSKIQYKVSDYENGILSGSMISTVLTDRMLNNFGYKPLTSVQYEALENPEVNTLYRLTDTGKVYLGSIDMSGGSSSKVTTMSAGLPIGGQNKGYVGTDTVTVTDVETVT